MNEHKVDDALHFLSELRQLRESITDFVDNGSFEIEKQILKTVKQIDDYLSEK